MIYACLRFIEEWAHPLTVVNFTLIGLSSGLVLGCALAAWAGESRLVQAEGPWAIAATLAAWAMLKNLWACQPVRLIRASFFMASGR